MIIKNNKKKPNEYYYYNDEYEGIGSGGIFAFSMLGIFVLMIIIGIIVTIIQQKKIAKLDKIALASFRK